MCCVWCKGERKRERLGFAGMKVSLPYSEILKPNIISQKLGFYLTDLKEMLHLKYFWWTFCYQIQLRAKPCATRLITSCLFLFSLRQRSFISVCQVGNKTDRKLTRTGSKASPTSDPGTGCSARTFSTPIPKSRTRTSGEESASMSRADRATARGKIFFRQRTARITEKLPSYWQSYFALSLLSFFFFSSSTYCPLSFS